MSNFTYSPHIDSEDNDESTKMRADTDTLRRKIWSEGTNHECKSDLESKKGSRSESLFDTSIWQMRNSNNDRSNKKENKDKKDYDDYGRKKNEYTYNPQTLT